jgi:hypothetical protein
LNHGLVYLPRKTAYTEGVQEWFVWGKLQPHVSKAQMRSRASEASSSFSASDSGR